MRMDSRQISTLMTWLFVLFVLMARNTDQSSVEITDVIDLPFVNTKQFTAAEGKNMTLTCQSDLESVTLEYLSVIYNNTKNNSGVYTVSFTKIATKNDSLQTVKCRAVNATDYKFESSANLYITAEDVSVTIGGVGEVGEGDTTNISCRMSRSPYLPSSVQILFHPTKKSPNLVNVLSNTTLQTRTELFDNITGTYTVTQSVIPVLVETNMDQGLMYCSSMINGSLYFSTKRYIVFSGPKENSVNMTGLQTGREGNNGKWTCFSNKGNPQVTFTWFNGSTQFDPGTPVVSPFYTPLEVQQDWNFKYSRDLSGTNITCVVTGYRNITVTRTRQFGQITFAPELAIKGDHVVDEGDTVNLTCEVVAASPMTVATWGDPVSSNRLVIPNIKSDANGKLYTCFAKNSVNNAFLAIRLNVQYGPGFFIRSNQWVKEGSNISITSGADGNPTPVISWRKKGNASVLSSDKTLFLASVKRKQAGVYTFKATSHRLRKNNLTEEFSKNATVVLEVRYGPGDSITFSPSLKNQTLTVEDGETIPQITCKADCVPKCEFRWTQYNRKIQISRSLNAVLDLGNASSSKVGLYVCKAKNNVGPEEFTRNVTFQLHVRYKPEIQSIGIDNYKNTYNENSPISVTTVIKAFPKAWVKWGFQNPLNSNQFMPLDARYNLSRTVNCLYDCVITEVLTLNQPLCTDSRNKYSLFAGNEKGNSSIRTTHYGIVVTCEPRLANVSLTNQTYKTCEGAELNMTVTFVAIPGPFIAWYLLPNTKRYVHYYEGRGFSYDKTYHTSSYHIPVMSRSKFGTYVVDGNFFRGGPDSRAYIQVVKDSNCTSLGLTVDSTTLSPTTAPSTTSEASCHRTNKDGFFVGIRFFLLVAFVLYYEV